MDVFPNKWLLSPTSISEIIRFSKQASLWEVTCKSKPGNVSSSQEYNQLLYNDMLLAINAIYDKLADYVETDTGTSKIPEDLEDSQSVKNEIGHLIFILVDSMMESQNSGNVLLGHILLLVPLIIAATNTLFSSNYESKGDWNNFWSEVQNILKNTNSSDGIWLSRAINRAQPGGLTNPGGEPLKTYFDFNQKDIENRILDANQSLFNLFQESASFDMISKQIVSNYEDIRLILINWVIPNKKRYTNISDFVCDLFLQILSSFPDSLIFRKNNQTIALQIQKKARQIVKAGGILSQQGKIKIKSLNQDMIKTKGKLNPGTSADLTACVLFIGLLFGEFAQYLET